MIHLPTARDNLLEALEREGSGELIHPYLGRKQVQVGGFSVNEAVGEGRLARFNVDFTETGEPLFPDQNTDAKNSTDSAADAAIDESAGFFETVFSVAGQAEFVVDQATADLTAGLDFMDESVRKFTDPIDALTFALLDFKQSAKALVRAPGELANRIKQTFQLLFDSLIGSASIAESVLGNFAGFSLPPVIGTTPSAVKAKENQTLMQNIFKQQSHTNQAKAAVEIDFTSVDEAIRIRDRVVSELDLQLNEDIGDDLFQDIKDVQVAIAEALPPLTVGTIITFTPPKTLPALVIAHTLFQDLDKEQEIIDQNNISNPGFVPGGVEIEVSSG